MEISRLIKNSIKLKRLKESIYKKYFKLISDYSIILFEELIISEKIIDLECFNSHNFTNLLVLKDLISSI